VPSEKHTTLSSRGVKIGGGTWGRSRVEKGYEAYCRADKHFYDAPALARRDDVDFELARRPLPEGWRKHVRDDWLVYEPLGVLPPQGWKIHASATLDSAEDILEAVWDYCVPRRIPFKFIASPDLVFLRNIKYAHRGSSGKFVTISPGDEAQFDVVLELGATADGRPDRRGATFRVPAWVSLPACLALHLQARNAQREHRHDTYPRRPEPVVPERDRPRTEVDRGER
jgi:hypothetical protein